MEGHPITGQAASERRRTLVTGAGGFCGANLVRRLLADGHHVTAVIRPRGARWRLDALDREVELREAELRDEEAVQRLIEASRPEWLFHLAAHPYFEGLRAQAETNLLATSSLLRAGADVDCQVFVHAGGSLEYGFKDHAPAEDELPEPTSEHGVTKAAATMLCRQVAASTGMRTVTLRLYSVFGPYERPGRFIPTLISHGLRGTLPPLADPRTQRDFVTVADTVEAFILAAVRNDYEPGAVYNIGSGKGTTLAEVVAVAQRALEIEAEPIWGSAPARPWDTSVWVSDIARARAELGWAPQCDFERGFKETVDWLRSEPSLWEVYGVRG